MELNSIIEMNVIDKVRDYSALVIKVEDIKRIKRILLDNNSLDIDIEDIDIIGQRIGHKMKSIDVAIKGKGIMFDGFTAQLIKDNLISNYSGFKAYFDCIINFDSKLLYFLILEDNEKLSQFKS